MSNSPTPAIQPSLPTSNSPKRLAVFIDVQNIYYTTRDTFGRQFDYRRLWAELESLGSITHAYAYAI
ncbi:NYN domain-containing protein, partial [Cobetia marina]